MHSVIITLILSLITSVNTANANDWSKLKKKKQTTLELYMTPAQAFDEMKKDGENILFVDVHTSEKLLS